MKNNVSKNSISAQVVGICVHKYRKENGLTLMELAKRANLNHVRIHRLEKGVTQMALWELFEICNAFKITPQRFFNRLDKIKIPLTIGSPNE